MPERALRPAVEYRLESPDECLKNKMPERALRLHLLWTDVLPSELWFKKQNAREGIKTQPQSR